MEIRWSEISFASFLRLLSKPSKYLALRVDPQLRHFKERKELWLPVEFLIYSIERVIFFSPTNHEALCIARERWQEPKPLTSISINFAYQSVTFTIVFHVERYWMAIIFIYFTRWCCEVKIRAKVHCKWINNPRWCCLRSFVYQRWSNDYEIH